MLKESEIERVVAKLLAELAKREEAHRGTIAMKEELLAEVNRLRVLHEGAVGDWRNACALLNKAEAEVERLRNEHGKIRNADAATLTDYRDSAHAANARAEKAEAALREVNEFLERAAFVDKEIVSTCRLSALSITNYRAAGLMYVNDRGLGWVVRTLHPALRAPAPDEQPKAEGAALELSARADSAEWPEDLRVREFPGGER